MTKQNEKIVSQEKLFLKYKTGPQFRLVCQVSLPCYQEASHSGMLSVAAQE